MKVETIQTICNSFLIGFAALAFICFCIKYPLKTICGIIGGVLGLAIPMLLAFVAVWHSGDQSAAGGFAFFPLLTIPLGIAAGVGVASMLTKKRSK